MTSEIITTNPQASSSFQSKNENLETETVPPPQYTTIITDTPMANDLPPAYDSLFSKLKKAKEESSNPLDYISKACGIMCGSVLITVIFAISAALPIVMIVIGSLFVNSCPINTKIPIWLIVTGSFGVLSSVIRTASNCYTIFRKRQDESYEASKKSCFTSVIELFLFAWFICGNVWVYSIKDIVTNDSTVAGTYCHSTCYYFAFWIITLSWIFMGLFCCCCCCILAVAGCGLGIFALKEAK